MSGRGEYSAGPQLVPARMLNELVYCQRLFHLEWVDGRWAHNDDTVQGSVAHDATDRRSGRMPAPDEEEKPFTSIQVALSDPDLGVTAVIDRVDHEDGSSSPVDMKKGSGPGDGGMWPADRVQVLTQAVLLRRAGYSVNRAEISYLGSHHRASIDVGPNAEMEVRELVALARKVAAQELPPPPLLNDPRCPRCSLAPLCMPDETNYLLERSSGQPRRIIVKNPDTRPVYVNTQGASVKVSGGRLLVAVKGETVAERRLLDVSQVCVVGNVQITTQALKALWRRGVTVIWLSYGGWLDGWSQGPMSGHVTLRRRQVLASVHGLRFAQQMIRGKIHNQRVLLRRNAKVPLDDSVLGQLKELEAKTESAASLETLLGIEGTAARLYFGQFHTLLSPRCEVAAEFQAHGRARRPPPDPVNAVLGFCYSLLTKDLVAVLTGVGLDPFLGVLHQPRYGRPALALDLAEEFRALVAESVALQCFNNGEINEKSFMRGHLGVVLTADGRRSVIQAYERRLDMELKHPLFGYQVSYRRVLDLQARVLAASFTGELEAYSWGVGEDESGDGLYCGFEGVVGAAVIGV